MHVVAEEAPTAVEYLPAAQLVQKEAAPRENAPAQQAEQTAAPAPEYRPAGQFKQELAAVCPGVVRYLPASHAVHVLALAALHVPAAQSAHAAVPLAALYVPAAHAVHVTDAPVNPALQLQFASAGDPLLASESEGHARHTPLVVAPVAAEYVFAAQFTQSAALVAPVVGKKVPARQSMHPDPAVANFPAAHAPHARLEPAPAAAPVPAAQARHASPLVPPVVFKNVPARQSMHPEPAAANFPAAHAPHAALEPAPAAAPVPAEQLRHTTLLVAPGVVENVPARQSRHPEPAGANFPATHAPHAALEFAPARAPVPAAQSRHAPLLVAPAVPEYLPPAQSMQVLALAAEYFPALQLEQEIAPVTPVSGHEYMILVARSASVKRMAFPISLQPDRSINEGSVTHNVQLMRFAQIVGSPKYSEFQMSLVLNLTILDSANPTAIARI